MMCGRALHFQTHPVEKTLVQAEIRIKTWFLPQYHDNPCKRFFQTSM